MDFSTMLIMWVASLLLTELLTKTPKAKGPIQEGVRLPGVEQSRPVPVVFGSGEVTPQLVWWGDVTVEKITKKVMVSLLKKQTITLGWEYRMGAVWALCHGPIDALHNIYVGDKPAFCGDTNSVVFNGDSNGGDIVMFVGNAWQDRTNPDNWYSVCDTYRGDPAGAWQIKDNPYLVTTRGLEYPVLPKGIAAIVQRGPSAAAGVFTIARGLIGLSPQVRPVKAFVTRMCARNFGSAYVIGANDENPVNIIYEIATSTRFGARVPTEKIDEASAYAVAARCDLDGIRLSYIWERKNEAWDEIQEICRHADLMFYQNPTTGKFTFKAIRDDYTVSSLPVFDTNNIESLDDFSRPSLDETRNEVKVNYMQTYVGEWTEGGGIWGSTIVLPQPIYRRRDASVAAQNLGNMQGQQGVLTHTANYPYITQEAVALKIAERDLRVVSYPLARLKMRVNREAFALNPGDPFVFAWSPLSISQIVFRVANIDPGTLEEPTILVDAIQDVFKIAASSYGTNSTGWTDPAVPPVASPTTFIDEAPYLLAEQQLGRFMVHARATGGAYDTTVYILYKLSTEPDYVLEMNNGVAVTHDFTPTGTLSANYSRATAYIDQSDTLVIGSGTGFPLLNSATADEIRIDGSNLVLFATGEIVGYESYTDNGNGTITLHKVHRGLLDTVPQNHTAGERVWFVSYGGSVIPRNFAAGEIINAKALTMSSLFPTLPETLAPVLTDTQSNRALKPLPPADVQTNLEVWAEVIYGELSISWRHRDRLTQTTVIDQDAANVGPEASTTYTVRIYNASNTLLHTESGITGTSYTYPEATEVSESGIGRLNDHLRITVQSNRDGYGSLYLQEREFDCGGADMLADKWAS